MPNNWVPSNPNNKPAKYDAKDWNATDITLLKKYKPEGNWSLNSDSDAAAKAAAGIRAKLETMHQQGTQAGHAVTNNANHTKPLTGAAAVAALQKQVSKAGVAKSEVKQKQAIDKKYPGLYKK
jgi:hypothetical protein